VFPKLKALEGRIGACVKKFYPDLLAIIFEEVRSKIKGVGRNETIEAQKNLQQLKQQKNLHFSFSPD
jgi:hypothetical protein